MDIHPDKPDAYDAPLYPETELISEDALPEWGDDFGQAVMDGREDSTWLLDAAVTGYDPDAGDEMELVRAPLADELETRGILGVADDETQIQYLQQVMRTGRIHVPDVTPAIDSAEAPACLAEHTELVKEYEAAQAKLLQAVAGATVEEADYGVCHTGNYEGVYALPDGTTVPVMHMVRVRSTKDDKLVDMWYQGAVDVHSYVLNNPPEAPHEVILCETNEYPKYEKIRRGDTSPGFLPAVLERMAQNLRLDGRKKGVEPWLDEYLALPKANSNVDTSIDFGASDMPLSARLILADTSDDRQNAIATLKMVFSGGSYDEVVSAAFIPSSDIAESLHSYGVTGRYLWLLRNAHQIGWDVAAAEKNAVDTGLYVAYATWRAQREAAIEKLNSLADDINKMALRPPDYGPRQHPATDAITETPESARPSIAARISNSIRQQLRRNE